MTYSLLSNRDTQNAATCRDSNFTAMVQHVMEQSDLEL
jgi:hypothetical protein